MLQRHKYGSRFLALLLTLVLAGSGTVVAFGAAGSGKAAPAIKAQINGKNVTFRDAAPKLIKGRTMVPFRHTMESLGATVSYDQKTKEITAVRENMTLKFAAGKNDLTITDGTGAVTVRKMDVAPFIDPATRRTYVPVRFLAESLDYTVGWDAEEKTVVILDARPFFSNLEKDFSTLFLLLKAPYDPRKNYETTGTLNMTLHSQAPDSDSQSAVYDPKMTPVDFSVRTSFNVIQSKEGAEAYLQGEINADSLMALPVNSDPEEKARTQAIVDALKKLSLEMRIDSDTGSSYFRTSVLPAIFASEGMAFDEKTWLKFNLYETEAYGIDVRKALQGNLYSDDPEELLQEALSEAIGTSSDMNVDTYRKLKFVYSFFKNLLGNEAFHKETSGGKNIYTLTVDKNTMAAAMMKAATEEGFSREMLESLSQDLLPSDLNMTLRIAEQGGKLSEYEMKGSGGIELPSNSIYNVTGEGKVTFFLSGGPEATKAEISFTSGGKFGFLYQLDSRMAETAKTPRIAPDAGDPVRDFF